jgi:hypothetical protein
MRLLGFSPAELQLNCGNRAIGLVELYLKADTDQDLKSASAVIGWELEQGGKLLLEMLAAVACALVTALVEATGQSNTEVLVDVQNAVLDSVYS